MEEAEQIPIVGRALHHSNSERVSIRWRNLSMGISDSFPQVAVNFSKSSCWLNSNVSCFSFIVMFISMTLAPKSGPILKLGALNLRSKRTMSFPLDTSIFLLSSAVNRLNR